MSLGLTLAKAFEGAAVGTLGAAKERDKKIEAEKTKRDVLFQQARRDVKEDIGKYNQAKESARKRFDLANAELSTMIGDSDERRAVAANMAKQFLDTGSLQTALDNYSTNIRQGDTPFEGLDFTNVNMEAFKNMSDTDVAAALVSPSLLPKGIDSHYKPSVFTDDSILFGGSGQPQALKAQQEQYASLAKASGLNITTPEGEIPVVSLPASSAPLNVMNFDQRLSLADTRLERAKKNGNKEEIARETERRRQAYADLVEYKQRTSTSKGGGGPNQNFNHTFIESRLKAAGDEPAITFTPDSRLQTFFTAIKDTDSGNNKATKYSAQREEAYRLYIAATKGSQNDLLRVTTNIEKLIRGNTIKDASKIRGGTTLTFTDMVEGIKSKGKIIAKGSDAYANLLPSQKELVNAYYSSKDRKAAANAFSARLADILVRGYFVPENALKMPKSEDATPQFKSLVKDILLQK
tara:strand:- start:85 stop:1479 length:1395 start_codon:yes stop_codon:yes gene_type:complete